MQDTKPKVSIVLPALNVGKYIRQCIESVLAQTLQDIEVICVDAGSTDGTLETIQEFVQKDPRVSLIKSEKKSYGYQMNIGFAAAHGEYLGIVETDDYADPDMFEKLYSRAVENDLDVVKSGFYFYYSKNGEKSIPNPIVSDTMANFTFCPMTYFESKREMVEFFNIKPTIWSAIYKAAFIRENNILFNETPGASYQDCSFNFKVWTCAKRVQLVQECYLHYRQDNEGSSVNSPGKVYCICDEYNEIERFLREERPADQGKLIPLMVRLKFDSYTWNYMRLAPQQQSEFIMRFHTDFYRHEADGQLQKEYFEYYKWNNAWEIINDPMQYHAHMLIARSESDYQGGNAFFERRINRTSKVLKKKGAQNSKTLSPEEYARIETEKRRSARNFKINNIKPAILRKAVRAFYITKDHGIKYTWYIVKAKIMRRTQK